MTDIQQFGNQDYISLQEAAEFFHIQYDSFRQLLKRYPSIKDEYCFKTKYKGRRKTVIKLDGLIVLANTKNIIKNQKEKKSILLGFQEAKKNLAKQSIKQSIKRNYQDPAWLEERNAGKRVRNAFTDIVKKFIDYGKTQGMSGIEAQFLISGLSGNENKCLFGMRNAKGVAKTLRDCLSDDQLATVSTCEKIMAKKIIIGMEKKQHYKEIINDAKKAAWDLSELVGVESPRLLQNNKSLLK